MTNPEKKLHLIESIKHYRLYNWITTCPGGFQTLQTGSGSKLLLGMLMVAALLVLMYFKVCDHYSDEAPAWFWWFTGLMVLFMLVAVVFTLYRQTIFDLEKGEVRVEVLGQPTFRRPFRAFEKFSFDPGYVVNGVDPGGVLYMHFKNGGKLRLAQLRDPTTLENLQRFVIGAIDLSN